MKTSTFQIFFLVVLVLITVAGVIIFATHGGSGQTSGVGKVTIWGTADQTILDQTLSALQSKNKSLADTVYVKQDPATFADNLVNAMASGNGPDLVLLPQDELVTFSNKLLTVPFSTLSQQTYTDSFIDEGRLFLNQTGIVAFPFMVDPMVMYWNRDLFAAAGLPQPPRYWSDMLDEAPKLTVMDASSNIQKSAISLGEWDNILYAKDILSLLFLQAGDPIMTQLLTSKVNKYQVVLGSNPLSAEETPAVSALQFYTEFSNPSKTSYSWNKTLPVSQDMFVAGDLAIYLGYASDLPTISTRNPNLNFGVALMPQIKGGAQEMTYGRLYGLAIPRTSPNPSGAAAVAMQLSSQAGIAALAANETLPPVRRDVTVDTSANAAASVFVQSALIARSWLDPGPSISDGVFTGMVQSVLSGKSAPAGAVADAAQVLQAAVSKLK